MSANNLSPEQQEGLDAFKVAIITVVGLVGALAFGFLVLFLLRPTGGPDVASDSGVDRAVVAQLRIEEQELQMKDNLCINYRRGYTDSVIAMLDRNRDLANRDTYIAYLNELC